MTHAPYAARLRRRRGSSVAEFVIIAPLLCLMMLAAYDMNKHAEDAQTVLLATRNAVYLGTLGGNAATARSEAVRMLADRQIDAGEKQEVALDPTQTTEEQNPAHSGTTLVLEGLRDMNDDERTICHQPDGLSPVGGTFADGYRLATDASDVADQALQPIMHGYGGALALTGFDPRNNMRVATTEATLSGARNFMARSIGSLANMVGKNGAAPVGRNLSHRYYVLGQSAFHTNDYDHSALVGAGLGFLLRPRWGASGSYSDDSDHLQTRCMSRLSMEPTCETDASYDQRQFLIAVQAIANAKLTLSYVLTYGTLGLGTIAEEGIKFAASKALDEVANQVLSKLGQMGTNMIRDYVDEQVQGLEDQIGDNAARSLSRLETTLVPAPDLVKHTVGE